MKGDYTICINQNMGLSEIGDATDLPVLAGFENANARDDYKYKVYKLELSSALTERYGNRIVGLIRNPISIILWQSPYDASQDFLYIPNDIGNVTVGKVMKINTTLFSGEYEYNGITSTPYFVIFKINDTMNCQIYDPNGYEDPFRDMLSGFDIISKKELPSKLTLIWADE
jgi:hypothetical protein